VLVENLISLHLLNKGSFSKAVRLMFQSGADLPREKVEVSLRRRK
jgi:hypothetical protein